MDLASASHTAKKIAWYRNGDGVNGDGDGSTWTAYTVTTSADGAYGVFAADIGGDGDIDLASASYKDDKIAWYENTDGLGTFGAQQVVTTSANVRSVFAADIDGDGDMDLASAVYIDDDIAWYENTDGQGTFGAANIVTTNADGAVSVFAADIDGDGDMDFASASHHDDKIEWYENTNGDGSTWTANIVTSANQVKSVFAADIDGDGDMDLASASTVDKIAWYENTDGQGTLGRNRS